MVALVQDRNTEYTDGELIAVPVLANTKIYAGALVAINAAGFAVPGAVATTLTYFGRAEAAADNTGGANGAKVVEVRRRKAFKWANHGADAIVAADLGKTCYIVDDQTVAKTNGGNTRSAAGQVVKIDADGVWVQ